MTKEKKNTKHSYQIRLTNAVFCIIKGFRDICKKIFFCRFQHPVVEYTILEGNLTQKLFEKHLVFETKNAFTCKYIFYLYKHEKQNAV